MARMRGTGLGMGMALGTAAVARSLNGVALLPTVPPRIVALQATRKLEETPEVILVAETFAVGMAMVEALQWARVVGLAVAEVASNVPMPPFPVVMGLPDLLEKVTEDVLLLVDATRGLILIDPDPFAIAHYQTEYRNIAPKRRLYLDEAHQLAQTQDGRVVQVMVQADSFAALTEGLSAGADAFYLTLPFPSEESALRRALNPLSEIGKPLLLPLSPGLPLQPLLEAAARIDLLLTVPPPPNDSALFGESGFVLPEANETTGVDWEALAGVLPERARAESRCITEEVVYALPALGVEIAFADVQALSENSERIRSLIEDLAAQEVTRLVFHLPATDRATLQALEEFVAVAILHALPIFVLLSQPPDVLDNLLGTGIAGVILGDSSTVESIKERLRELSYSTCRESLLSR